MVFNSLHFVWFFVVVYAVYRALPHRGQNWLLLLASYYFYAAWDWRFLGLLLASTVVDYSCARALDGSGTEARRKAILWLSIGFNLSVLGFFKYFNFFADNLHALLSSLGWRVDFVTIRVLLPIGISFYTFMTMSYVIDVYRREIPATRRLLEFAVFVAYFPHLVAGPILRASRLLPQIHEPRRISGQQVRDGLWLIAWGFFLKIFVADNVAGVANAVFEPDTTPTGINVLVGVYAFTLQIFGDFAGYTNIARGTSKLMGIELVENFRFPYLVRSPQEFWRHWHISLSTWLRDYLYIPLGGNRGGSLFTYRNLMLTMLIGGLWHGAGWTFVAWGAIHGTALVGERWWRERPGYVERPSTAWGRAWQRFLTFQVVCLAWIFFRSDSFSDAWELIARLFTAWGESSELVTGGVLLAIAVGIGSQYLPRRLPLALMARFSRLPVPAQALVLSVALLAVHAMGPEGVAPFIYFRF